MPFERYRIIPLVVAFPLFLQNLDTSVMATALPSIADSLQVNALHLNIAITSYLLSLAVFLPLAGWLAERFGARRVFCGAIIFFSLGSALCGAATSLSQLVAFRMVQGMGGALMVPVGRLILLHSIPKSRMVSAMVWFTVPGVIGRMAGPLVGGLIVTITSWRWIFLVNIPFCILGVGLALMFIDKTHERSPQPFDFAGFCWAALRRLARACCPTARPGRWRALARCASAPTGCTAASAPSPSSTQASCAIRRTGPRWWAARRCALRLVRRPSCCP
jgi:MFS family permease